MVQISRTRFLQLLDDGAHYVGKISQDIVLGDQDELPPLMAPDLIDDRT